MQVTRADFLRYTSLAAGLAVMALSQSGPAEASASPAESGQTPPPPGGPDGLLDSQRFRQAVEQGDLARVKSYLERDPALAGSRDERGRSVFVLASLAGHTEVADALRARLGSLDLVETVLAGDAKRVGEILGEHPRLVNEIHPAGGSAVHMAVRRGRTDLVFAMLRPGPDFNLPSAAPEALTPLRLAVDHPDPALADELVDAMIGNGGNPNAPQGDGVSPLQAALKAGRTEIVRLLAFNGAEGADPSLPRNHRTSRFSYTADGSRFQRPEQPAYPWPVINEYVAVAHGNLARMKELLDLYPKLLHVNASWDELAVEAGAHVGFKDGVRFLLDQGAPAALPTAAMMGMTAHVKKLLAEDPGRIWECGAHNMPPMWFPAIGGGDADHLEIARLLLDAGADPNAHKRGQTALHWAARGGQMELAELLISKGARVDALAKTPQGDTTPLAHALRAEKPAMAELLRRHGARGVRPRNQITRPSVYSCKHLLPASAMPADGREGSDEVNPMKRIDFRLSTLLTIAFCGLVLALGASCQNVVDLLEAYAESSHPEKNPQKRTVGDIRNTGTAMFSWLTDEVGAAAAGQSQVPQTLDLAEYAAISHADLATILVPTYIREVPELDGWESPYEYYLDVANPLAQKVMSIRSPGKDGAFSDTAYTVGAFDPESFDEDIVWADGFFVRWPQKK